jgi:hypothetical protein
MCYYYATVGNAEANPREVDVSRTRSNSPKIVGAVVKKKLR